MVNISVVIPTCNRIELLKEAVQCVLEQSNPAYEIIVVNNGSAPLLENLFPQPVKIFELPPFSGVANARNQGAVAANGEYIAFLDDDDLWEKDYLKKAATLINEMKPDCVITRLDRLENHQVKPYKNAEGKINLHNLFTWNPGIGGQTTIVRREAFLATNGYDNELPPSEDKSLIIEFLLQRYFVVSAPHIQSILRVHNLPRLTDAEFMQRGISRFLKKYREKMTLPQKNFNWVKIHYYRYLVNRKTSDFLFYYSRLLLHNFFRILDPTLPYAPKL